MLVDYGIFFWNFRDTLGRLENGFVQLSDDGIMQSNGNPMIEIPF